MSGRKRSATPVIVAADDGMQVLDETPKPRRVTIRRQNAVVEGEVDPDVYQGDGDDDDDAIQHVLDDQDRGADEQLLAMLKEKRIKFYLDDAKWNAMYSVFESPKPAVPPDAVKLNAPGGNAPGLWCWRAIPKYQRRGTAAIADPSSAAMGMHIARLYYQKSESGEISRQPSGLANTAELLRNSVDLTVGEAKRLALVLIKFIQQEEKGTRLNDILRQDLSEL